MELISLSGKEIRVKNLGGYEAAKAAGMPTQ
jgi:hypothetical protein